MGKVGEIRERARWKREMRVRRREGGVFRNAQDLN
jgi:hypothetical protein